jgi:hypothetical protein
MRIVMAVLAFALIGCGDATSPTSNRFVGTWTASTIGGNALPAITQNFPQFGIVDTTYTRTITIDDSGTLSVMSDSTIEFDRTSGTLRKSNASYGGFLTWTASDTAITVTRKNPCLCYGPMFTDVTLYSQRDGTLTARLDAGLVTVFRRQ